MTAFMLLDELERDFEPLEEHPARHAAALAMYCLTGQKVAQRMLDGRIPRALLNKTFSAWGGVMVSLAIADLVAIGQWEEADGELRFRHWDDGQFTKEQEEARRAKQRDRQRDRRTRKRLESATVTRDVPCDVAPDVTVPSASASASGPTPEPHESERARSRPLDTRERNEVGAASLVRREFARRFEAAEGSFWPMAGDPAVELLARWLVSLRGDMATNLAKLLDGFFADEWCHSAHFPVRHLARHPQKYFEPRSAPAPAATVDRSERIVEINTALSELEGSLAYARSMGDLEQVAELVDRKDELIAELRKLKGAA